jgi:hypothetical protein
VKLANLARILLSLESDVSFIDVNGALLKLFLNTLCGLVARAPGYRFRGQGSIPGAVIFSEE